MHVKEVKLENTKCFKEVSLSFLQRKDEVYPWITLLGPNGGGKSTVLQALALLLAGPEGAQALCPRPVGWLRDESKPGKISLRLHQGKNDPGQYGTDKITTSFGYMFHITGSQRLNISNKTFTEPGIHGVPERYLTWLRQNAFASKGQGWFSVGYGAFRRLTRSSQVIVPSLQPQARYTHFTTQFDEDQPLSAFERWMVYLDYRIVKDQDQEAARQKEIGIAAINRLLPDNVAFDSVTSEGRILFRIGTQRVPTIALSDGYRSVLALGGDLVWRLIQSFPQSENPPYEEGVVLIDELDIHLHPKWQRELPVWLRTQFPHLQFIVATHSPLIAAGAGEDALTLRFEFNEQTDDADIRKVTDIAAMNVDRILQSDAFGLVSPYSPQTQAKIEKYDNLASKAKRNRKEESEFEQLSLFIEQARPFGGPPDPDSLEARMDAYLEQALHD